MGLNPDLLELDAAAMLLTSGQASTDVVQLALLFSAAISLRRIADHGEPIISAVVDDAFRDGAAHTSAMIEIAPGGKAPLRPGFTQGPVVADTETPSIPAGFTPHDGSAQSPVDRNHQVQVFYRRGKPSKPLFGQSVSWPWTGGKDDVIGWRYLGDGAEVSSSS